jgi:5-methylcytosine-specific restriction protein A
MSTRRRGIWGPKGTGPNGRPLCFCGCGREVPKPARTKFEPACWLNWAAKNDPATQRRLVNERDHGVCALCGVNAEQRARQVRDWERVIRWLARRHFFDLLDRGELKPYKRHPGDDCPAHQWDAASWADAATRDEIVRRFGPGIVSANGHTWEADHIIPVIEGGGECDLSNLRTLCLKCHREQTAALAKRRAAARKAAREAAQLNLLSDERPAA